MVGSGDTIASLRHRQAQRPDTTSMRLCRDEILTLDGETGRRDIPPREARLDTTWLRDRMLALDRGKLRRHNSQSRDTTVLLDHASQFCYEEVCQRCMSVIVCSP